MNERRPIPEAVLLPEERAALEEAGEPKLEGAPESESDSAILNTPEYAVAAGDLADFSRQNSEHRQILQRERVRSFLQNPERLPDYLNALEDAKMSWTSQQKLVGSFETEFEQNFEKYISRVNYYSPASLAGWLKILAHNETYKPYAERVFRTLLEKAKAPEETEQLLYDLAQAAAGNQDQKAMEQGFRILLWDTDLIKPGSATAINHIKSRYSKDDEILRKYIELETTLLLMGKHYSPESEQHFKSAYQQQWAQETTENSGAEYEKWDPKRARLLETFFRNVRTGNREFSKKQLRTWPDSIFMKHGPLRKQLNRWLESQDETTISFNMPGLGGMTYSETTPKDLREAIYKHLQELPQGTEPDIADAETMKVLFYLRPDMTPDQERAFLKDNMELRQNVVRDEIRSLSPRGDKILVTDEELKKLGFESITYEVGEPVEKTKVTLEVGKYKFFIQLSEDLLMETMAGGQDFEVSNERRAFLEQIILSHLYELQCSERIKVGYSRSGQTAGEQEKEHHREFTSRRSHLMKLPRGKGFTLEAKNAAKQNKPRPYDLVALNAKLGLTRQEGQKTYVPPTENVAIGDRRPMVSKAPRAMDRAKRLLALGGEK